MLITTRDVAKKLGMNYRTLARYLAFKKIPLPKVIRFGNFKVYCWTPKEIARLRTLAPKIYGRKMRYKGKLLPLGIHEPAKRKAKSKKKRK